MKKIVHFLLFGVFILSYSSCKTDFDVAAPYKETMVIYGLLNPTDHPQYIRVSKAYLGEGNSLIMAQERDSIYYGSILNVTLQRLSSSGVVLQESSMTRDTTIPKDSGIFYYPYQVIYSSPDSMRFDSKYKIKVTNTQTGLTASAETKIVGSFLVDHPTDHGPGVSPNFNFTLAGIYNPDFYPAPNGYVYNLKIRFHYKDLIIATNDSTEKYVDWDLGDQVGAGQPKITYTMFRPDLYRVVGSTVLSVDTTVIERKISSPPIEFIFTAGSEDLYTYQQLIAPSIGIVQDRPLFTNVENGIGLVTSKYVKSLSFNFDGISRAAFDTSRYTRNLHFH